MSTAETTQQPRTVAQFIRDTEDADPKTALDLAMAENARLEREAHALTAVDLVDGVITATSLSGLQRLGRMFAASTMVPDDFRGQEADCAIICNLAQRWGVDPFMAFQQVYIVHGKPGISGQLALALLESSGEIMGTVKYDFGGEGDNYGAVASCLDKQSGKTISGPKVDWRMVKAERWNAPTKLRKGGEMPSKWTTMPDLMFRYRSASYLVRTQYPHVTMGLLTKEELDDMGTKATPGERPEGSKSDHVAALLRKSEVEEKAAMATLRKEAAAREKEPPFPSTSGHPYSTSPQPGEPEAAETATADDAGDDEAGCAADAAMEEYHGLAKDMINVSQLGDLGVKARQDSRLFAEQQDFTARMIDAKIKSLKDVRDKGSIKKGAAQ